MMNGGFFMMGFGLLAMLLVVILPIVLIGVLVWALTQKNNPANPTPLATYPTATTGRFCANCGTPLQTGWSHCPQCGAPAA